MWQNSLPYKALRIMVLYEWPYISDLVWHWELHNCRVWGVHILYIGPLSWSLSSVRIIMIAEGLFYVVTHITSWSQCPTWSSGYIHCLLIIISWNLTFNELLAIDLCSSKTVPLFFHLLSCALLECQELPLSFCHMCWELLFMLQMSYKEPAPVGRVFTFLFLK